MTPQPPSFRATERSAATEGSRGISMLRPLSQLQVEISLDGYAKMCYVMHTGSTKRLTATREPFVIRSQDFGSLVYSAPKAK